MSSFIKERRDHLRLRASDHRRRRHDETANTWTHFGGFLLSVLGCVFLLILSIRSGDPWHIVSASVYGVTLLTLYTASTLYHFADNPRRRLRLRLFDHCAIFLFIAGSYTPFTLVGLRGGWGWSIFVLAWAGAIAGCLLKIFITNRSSILSTGLYLLLGWLSIIAIVPLWNALPPGGFVLLVTGGLAYTAGTYFFTFDHRRFFHATWHLCVVAGSVLHYLAILGVLSRTP